MMLNQAAMRLLTLDGTEGLDRNQAVLMLEKASEYTEGKNLSVLSMMGRAKFLAGDKAGAVAAIEEAMKHAPNEQVKAKLEQSLVKYRGEPAADAAQ
jgi:hypothetical protein